MSDDEEVELDPAAVRSFLYKLVVGVIAVSLVFTLFGAAYTVDDGERTVVTRFGEVQKVSDPGLHLKIPMADAIHPYEVRTQAYTMSSAVSEGDKVDKDDSIDALTAEGLNVEVDITVRYHIDPTQVGEIYENVGTNERAIVERIVRPTTREAVRSSSSQYDVESIYSNKRAEFSDAIEDDIRDDFESKGLVLEAVQVRNIMLPEKIRDAIQDKQATQEQIEQKRNQLEVEKLEKQRRVIEAEGIAESQAIIDDTLSQEYLRYLWIQEGLEKGDAIYVPIGDNGLPIYKDVDSIQDDGGANNTTDASIGPDVYTNRTNTTAGG